MTAEEMFDELAYKYGDEFHWRMLPSPNQSFVAELKKEIGETHFLYHERICAVAKCDSNDGVLFAAGNEDGLDIYYLFHLTYSAKNMVGYPTYIKFKGIQEVKEYLEQDFH